MERKKHTIHQHISLQGAMKQIQQFSNWFRSDFHLSPNLCLFPWPRTSALPQHLAITFPCNWQSRAWNLRHHLRRHLRWRWRGLGHGAAARTQNVPQRHGRLLRWMRCLRRWRWRWRRCWSRRGKGCGGFGVGLGLGFSFLSEVQVKTWILKPGEMGKPAKMWVSAASKGGDARGNTTGLSRKTGNNYFDDDQTISSCWIAREIFKSLSCWNHQSICSKTQGISPTPGLDDASSFLLKLSFGLELRFCLLHRLLLVLCNQPRMERVHNGALLCTICSLWFLGPGGYHLIHRFIHIVLKVGRLNPLKGMNCSAGTLLLGWDHHFHDSKITAKSPVPRPQEIFPAWKLRLPWQVTSPLASVFCLRTPRSCPSSWHFCCGICALLGRCPGCYRSILPASHDHQHAPKLLTKTPDTPSYPTTFLAGHKGHHHLQTGWSHWVACPSTFAAMVLEPLVRLVVSSSYFPHMSTMWCPMYKFVIDPTISDPRQATSTNFANYMALHLVVTVSFLSNRL